jgi:glycosyltransferase involved in cell wall biosynthesis
MATNQPLISVVIPAFNNDEELKQTLASVQQQIYCNIEIIVVDDGSTIDMLPVINEANDNRISYCKIPHANANVARNWGINQAKGNYIAMLDSGDIWLKEHLEESLLLLTQHQVDGLYGSLECTQGMHKKMFRARALELGETMADYILATAAGAQTSTLFMTADSVKDILWDENLNRHQDYDFVIRYSKKYQLIPKEHCTVIHPVTYKTNYDFEACIRFINLYKNEICDNTLSRYYRGMLRLAKRCEADNHVIDFYIKAIDELYHKNKRNVIEKEVKISVIMPVYNAAEYVQEAIESVLKQSFEDFELIIIDDASEDDTLPIVNSFLDKRISVLQNQHNFIGSLNLGLQQATGKYIARMDADDIMHIDRLKIQHAIMEEEPCITVCASWMIPFGENVQAGRVGTSLNGLVEFPVLQLLRGNFVYHPTVMMRKDFLDTHQLRYENYECAEDYKLWFEIAKRKGIFYIESQPLLNYRISEIQVSKIKQKEQQETVKKIVHEIIKFLIDQNKNDNQEISTIYQAFSLLESKSFLTLKDILSFFWILFMKNKSKFTIC